MWSREADTSGTVADPEWCGNVGLYCKGMCEACYRYKRRTGKARPKELMAAQPVRVYYNGEHH